MNCTTQYVDLPVSVQIALICMEGSEKKIALFHQKIRLFDF